MFEKTSGSLRAFSASPDSLGGKKNPTPDVYMDWRFSPRPGCRLGQARFRGGWPLHKISQRSLGTVGFRESEYILLAASNRLRLRKGTISKGTVCLPTSLFRAHVSFWEFNWRKHKKTTMELEKSPSKKKHHLPNLHFCLPALDFRRFDFYRNCVFSSRKNFPKSKQL